MGSRFNGKILTCIQAVYTLIGDEAKTESPAEVVSVADTDRFDGQAEVPLPQDSEEEHGRIRSRGSGGEDEC